MKTSVTFGEITIERRVDLKERTNPSGTVYVEELVTYWIGLDFGGTELTWTEYSEEQYKDLKTAIGGLSRMLI